MSMPAESIPALMTAEELIKLQLPGKSTELVRGRLVVREPPSTWHGRIQANLAYLITDFVRKHRLGVVFGQDTGFKIFSDPDTVRAPDVAFVSQARGERIPKRGYAALVPDFVAEIVSPDDRAGELLAKVADWLQAGTRLVWVVDPQRDEARVYRAV
jgi:Uma2 family endonuclease